MVKLGFIAEGGTEKIILESPAFQAFLQEINLDYVENVVDVTGNNNLLPKYLPNHIKILEDQGANFFIILTDLDRDQCITLTKRRIGAPEFCLIIVSIKEIEAWFLSDSLAMQSVLKSEEYSCPEPESIDDPFSFIRELVYSQTGQGVGNSKIRLAKKMLKNGFSIPNAASHPNCSSAQYFVNQLKETANFFNM